jgi:hypothetical protein
MSDIRRLVFAIVLFVVVSTTLLAQVQHRPIGDFLAAQTMPPVWWVDPAAEHWIQGQIDYAGYENNWLIANGHPGLGTEFSGDMTETLLPDGRTQVHLVLRGTNVFMRANYNEDFTTVFGYGPVEIVNGDWPAAVGEFVMTLDFINNQGLGGSMPEIRQLVYRQVEGLELQSLLLNGRALGPLREGYGVPNGTPGSLHIVQRVLFSSGKAVPAKDYAPAELVRVGILERQP